MVEKSVLAASSKSLNATRELGTELQNYRDPTFNPATDAPFFRAINRYQPPKSKVLTFPSFIYFRLTSLALCTLPVP